jgi:ribonuclease BN (tRNA processing enzyme)
MGWSMGANGEISMRLFIGGMRGSRPCTGGSFEEFGGDTTSLLLIGSQNERLILDAGTGMRAIAEQLAATEPGNVTILFSHYHLDHLFGLTMNPLFHKSNWFFKFAGPTLSGCNIRDAVTRFITPPYWPIPLEKMNAKFEFVEFSMNDIYIDKLRVRGCPVPHPGGCISYRIEDTHNDTSIVFATDIEWQKRTDSYEKAFIKMCSEPKPADLLIIDAHFARAETNTFAGWGHTCWEDDLDIAASAKIKNVLLSHHKPEAADEILRAIEQEAKEIMPGAMVGRAGQWLTIGDKKTV